MKVVSIFNRKGGVGKTSITAALAMFFGGIGKKVLCLDLDSQMNLSLFMSGCDEKDEVQKKFEYTIADVINEPDDFDIRRAIYPAGKYLDDENPESCSEKNGSRVYFIPGTEEIDTINNDLRNHPEKLPQFLLQRKLQRLDDSWDIILQDNSPSENLIAIMSLVAAESGGIIVPVTPDLSALAGLKNCKKMIDTVQTWIPDLKYLGCILNNYKARESVSQYTLEVLKEDEESNFSGVTIRSASKIPYAGFIKEGIVNTDRYLQGLSQSQKVADDIIRLGEFILREIGE